jgi:hypothetical protein
MEIHACDERCFSRIVVLANLGSSVIYSWVGGNFLNIASAHEVRPHRLLVEIQPAKVDFASCSG